MYSEKAYKQCRLMSTEPFVKSIGVVIQEIITPVISGLTHTNSKGITINWIEGHLSRIVSGEVLGYSIDVYKNDLNEYVIRGIEGTIVSILDRNYESIIKELIDSAEKIKGTAECEQEIEWIYDGTKVWFVQTQALIL